MIFIGQYNDAITIILAIFIVSTVGFIQEYKSEKSVQALSQFMVNFCEVLRGKKNGIIYIYRIFWNN